MRKRAAAVVALLAAFLVVSAPLAGAKGPKPGNGNSDAAHKCQQGGYLSLVGSDGTTFKNVGACVSYAAHGGTFATGLVVPAGHTATLSNAQFGDVLIPTAPLAPNTFTNCPGDTLIYGYQLNLGSNVQVGGPAAGCVVLPGAVIGPFSTAVLLRVWLTDTHAPGPFTFYSDGNHATTAGTNPTLISIRDSFFGTIPPTVPFTSPAGDGNLNVVVTIS